MKHLMKIGNWKLVIGKVSHSLKIGNSKHLLVIEHWLLRIPTMSHLLKIGNWLLKIISRALFPLRRLSKRNRRIATFIAILVIIPVVIYSISQLGRVEAAWFDEDFGFRQRVDITNSGSAQTDFQVAVTLDTAALITAGKLRSNCNDIRITDINGKLLPFVIEEGSAPCNNASTKIWTKVPSISTTGNTLYIYYGNPGAANIADGSKVFDYFDNFSESGINTNLWISTGAYTVSGGAVTVTTGALWSPTPVLSEMRDMRFEYRAKWAATATAYSGMQISNASSIAGSNGNSNKLIMSMSNGAVNIAQTGWAADGTAASYNIVSGTTLYTPTADTYYVDGFSMDSSNVRYYNNGSTTNTSAGTFSAAPYLFIGSFLGSGAGVTNITDITVDWVRARKFAATEPTVAAPTNEEIGPGPVGYWKFDEGTGTTANDSSSNRNNGTLTNMSATPATNSGWMTEDACIKGKCLAFDGNDYVNLSNSVSALASNTKGTVTGWFKRSTTTNRDVIFSYNESSSSDRFLIEIDEPTANAGKLRVVIREADVNLVDIASESTYEDTNWHHFAVTNDDTNQVKIYVDGIDQTPSSPTANSNSWFDSVTSKNTLRIGSDNRSGGPFMIGRIDELNVYSYARSEAQVKVDYNLGSGSVLGASDANKNLSNGLVGYWKMDETLWNGTAREVRDSSGGGNDGTAVSGAATASAKFGNGGLFDGTNDYVDAGTGSSLDMGTGNFTISAWFKTNSSSNEVIAGKGAVGTAGKRYMLDLSNSDCGVGKVKGEIDDDTTKKFICSTSTYNDNNWHHVVLIRNGANLKLYLDGTSAASDTDISGYGNINSSRIFSIGSIFDEPTVTQVNFFNGTIDETRMYNRVLSPREVQQLYNFAPGPIHYWSMEEKSGGSIIDTSGGNNATISGDTKWAAGKYGSGLTFDGDSDYAVVGTNPTISPNSSFTYEVWVKIRSYTNGTTGDGAGTYIIDRGGIPGSPLVDLKPVADGYGYQTRYDDGTGLGGPTGGKIILNQWQHVAMVRDYNNSFTIYVDGVKVGSTTDSGSKTLTPPRPKLGGHALVCGCVDGMVDEFKIYNYARTAGQIVEDMNAGHPAPGSPVGSALLHLKFDDGFGTVASNSGNLGSAGNAELYSFPSPATVEAGWAQDGKFGKALSFSGVNNYGRILDNSALDFGANEDFSYSFWMKKSTSTASQFVIAKGSAGNADPGYSFVLSGGTQPLCEIGHTSGARITTSTASNITDTNWHHITCVYNRSGNLILYVDGKQNATADISSYASVSQANAYNLVIGQSSTRHPSFVFNGQLDEIKVYNSALTASQVKLEYNRGSSMVLGSLSDTSGLAGGSVASNSASAEYCVPGDTASCTSPVGRWDFEEGKGTQANDISGNENSATLTGGPAWTTGKIGKAISFDNSDDYLNCGTTGMPTAYPVTLEAWAYFNTDQTDYDYVIQASSFTGSDDLVAMAREVTTNKLYYVENGTVRSGPVIPTARWTHITMVFTTTSVKAYINGVEQPITQPSTTMTFPGAGCSIGRFTGPGNYMKGKIDQVRVFNYARSAAQVAWDYNKGLPTGHYKLDECQGATINDSIRLTSTISGTLTVGGSGTQTSIGTCSTASTAWGNGITGKFNYSINLDGTDDYVSIPDADYINDFPANHDLTVSIWAKTPTTQVNTVVTENMMVEKWDSAFPGGYPYVIRIANQTSGTPGRVYGARYDGTNVGSAVSTKSINDNQWHHIVFAKKGSSLFLYLDGKLNVTGTDTTVNSTTTASPVYLGRRGGIDPYYYTGTLDDFRVFNYGLTATQVKVLYNNGAVTFGPSSGAP